MRCDYLRYPIYKVKYASLLNIPYDDDRDTSLPCIIWNNYFVKYQEWIQNSLVMCQKCCIRGCFVVVDNIALSDSVDAY